MDTYLVIYFNKFYMDILFQDPGMNKDFLLPEAIPSIPENSLGLRNCVSCKVLPSLFSPIIIIREKCKRAFLGSSKDNSGCVNERFKPQDSPNPQAFQNKPLKVRELNLMHLGTADARGFPGSAFSSFCIAESEPLLSR